MEEACERGSFLFVRELGILVWGYNFLVFVRLILDFYRSFVFLFYSGGN